MVQSSTGTKDEVDHELSFIRKRLPVNFNPGELEL